MFIYQSKKYLPTSIFANLQKGGLNHIIFLFSIFNFLIVSIIFFSNFICNI